jgi:hypothetical protein
MLWVIRDIDVNAYDYSQFIYYAPGCDQQWWGNHRIMSGWTDHIEEAKVYTDEMRNRLLVLPKGNDPEWVALPIPEDT